MKKKTWDVGRKQFVSGDSITNYTKEKIEYTGCGKSFDQQHYFDIWRSQRRFSWMQIVWGHWKFDTCEGRKGHKSEKEEMLMTALITCTGIPFLPSRAFHNSAWSWLFPSSWHICPWQSPRPSQKSTPGRKRARFSSRPSGCRGWTRGTGRLSGHLQTNVKKNVVRLSLGLIISWSIVAVFGFFMSSLWLIDSWQNTLPTSTKTLVLKITRDNHSSP